ncbi:uncharacterized protein Dwil_GK13261 [Drosophila willistoni]|uniref:Lipase domain-containing protein n=1 Tax=Drosophila willistoni TaxID=7260 RepID=B4NL12_DROWI|nr:lipase member H [Drosophila willistoni]EDW84215.2 uncharacterized protein Dwil_GK13261 [Drosophila willistoni]
MCAIHCQALGTAANGRLFAYESGKCEITMSNLVEGMFQNELKILLGTRAKLPQSKLLQFDLYTRLNPQKRQLLRPGDVEVLKNSNFNAKWPVRIQIHGWAGSSSSCSNAAIKDAYLSRGDFNVIILDWSRQSLDISYPRVSRQLQSIAQTLAKFIRFLNETTGVPFEQFYLVGHSAGCHISGLTGKLLKPQRLGAIIALDPAGLVQRYLGPKERLAPDDANYVESIHTDITLLGNPSDRLSHASFFVNWGLGQPHCPNGTATEFDFVCDHFAALYYYVESVRRPQMFGAVRCNSVDDIQAATCGCAAPSSSLCTPNAFMGGEPAVPKKGVYYFSTRQHLPFAYNDNLVHIQKPQPSTVAAMRPLGR